MKSLQNVTLSEIRRTLDSDIYGDESRDSNWSKMIATALLDKRPHTLAEFLSHGKGFNDCSKRAVCNLLGVKPTFNQKGMDAIIAEHCGITLERFLLERKRDEAKWALSNSEEALNSFANPEEICQWIQGLIKQGYNKVISQGKKSFIVNTEDRGFHLERAAVRKYAQALLEFNAISNELAQ